MKVHIDRNNIHVELMQFRKKKAALLPLESFKWKTFATDMFMKLGSLLPVRCHHHSVKSRGPALEMCGVVVKQGLLFIDAFPANKERRQLGNSAVDRYRKMDSEGRIIEVVLGTEFSDYDRRTGNNKTRPKAGAGSSRGHVYDSLDRLATTSERASSNTTQAKPSQT